MEALKSISVGQILERGAAQVPDKIAVVDGKLRKTFDELNRITDALAAALADIGLIKGDRAAIYMKNSFEFMVAFYALQKLGVIAVWINSMYRKTESEFILNNSEAKAVFIFNESEGHDYLTDVLSTKKDSATLEKIILVGDGKGLGVYSFYDLIAAGHHKKIIRPVIDTRQDLAMLLYTSGTTGNQRAP